MATPAEVLSKMSELTSEWMAYQDSKRKADKIEAKIAEAQAELAAERREEQTRLAQVMVLRTELKAML